MDVKITHNQQTSREGKKKLQQVRRFTQKDVSFASRWAVNNNKVEADWVELEGESQLFKCGWMSFHRKQTYTDGVSMMTARPPSLFPGFVMLTALKSSRQTDRRISSLCSGVSQVKVMARRSRSDSMMCFCMTVLFLNSYLELSRQKYRNFFAKQALFAATIRYSLQDEGTLATLRFLIMLYFLSWMLWEISGEKRRERRSYRLVASGIAFMSFQTMNIFEVFPTFTTNSILN